MKRGGRNERVLFKIFSHYYSTLFSNFPVGKFTMNKCYSDFSLFSFLVLNSTNTKVMLLLCNSIILAFVYIYKYIKDALRIWNDIAMNLHIWHFTIALSPFVLIRYNIISTQSMPELSVQWYNFRSSSAMEKGIRWFHFGIKADVQAVALRID